jgi:NitT/TauT family transport system permease protein
MQRRFASHLPAIVLFLLVILLWHLMVQVLEIPRYILPKPALVVERIWIDRWMLLENLRTTMLSAVIGFVIGVTVALALGTLFIYSKTVERALTPWAIIIKTIPALAIAPLLTIWLGFGLAPKIAIAAIASFFPILVNFQRGLASIKRKIAELLALLDASTTQGLVKVRLFAALPFTFAALKISSGMAVLAAIVAEFTGANRALSRSLLNAAG